MLATYICTYISRVIVILETLKKNTMSLIVLFIVQGNDLDLHVFSKNGANICISAAISSITRKFLSYYYNGLAIISKIVPKIAPKVSQWARKFKKVQAKKTHEIN